MIKVSLAKNNAGLIRKFSAKGHAGYGPYGEDILCAAVSAIAQTVIGSLQDIAGFNPDYILQDGDIRCEILDFDSLTDHQIEIARILMESFAVGCKQFEASYGSDFVKVKEVRYQQRGGARA
ncbi:MAG: ribosomal-processing cysteine protease Prp [Eubacteriales bacterium]|nr:ribosomal-processing cysteine protease Prp [Eubacteriales bacterium]